MKTSHSVSGLTAIAVSLLIVLTVSLTSCRNDIVYSRFSPISSSVWAIDSVAQFDYTIADAQAEYSILVYVRHTERYPYQNMWLFVGDSLHRDTIEFYLADDRGQWLGDKHHGFIEMPVLLEDNYHFPDIGAYYIDITHGMRDTLLRGITDIGFEILKQ